MARRRTRVLRFCLDVLTKPAGCPVRWDDMPGGDCERRCPHCDVPVFDVTAMSPEDAEAFLEENLDARPPFLKLRRRSDGRLIESECARGARRRLLRRAGGVVLMAAAGAAVLFVIR